MQIPLQKVWGGALYGEFLRITQETPNAFLQTTLWVEVEAMQHFMEEKDFLSLCLLTVDSILAASGWGHQEIMPLFLHRF